MQNPHLSGSKNKAGFLFFGSLAVMLLISSIFLARKTMLRLEGAKIASYVADEMKMIDDGVSNVIQSFECLPGVNCQMSRYTNSKYSSGSRLQKMKQSLNRKINLHCNGVDFFDSVKSTYCVMYGILKYNDISSYSNKFENNDITDFYHYDSRFLNNMSWSIFSLDELIYKENLESIATSFSNITTYDSSRKNGLVIMACDLQKSNPEDGIFVGSISIDLARKIANKYDQDSPIGVYLSFVNDSQEDQKCIIKNGSSYLFNDDKNAKCILVYRISKELKIPSVSTTSTYAP